MKKLLVLASRFPFPLEKGDKLRLFHQLQLLQAEYRIYLFACSDQPVDHAAREAVAALCERHWVFPISRAGSAWSLAKNAFSALPFQVAYFFRPGILRQMQRLAAEIQPDLVYCQLLRMAPYAQGLPYPTVLDYMDCFSAGVKRRVARVPRWQRAVFRNEYQRLLGYEARIYPDFQAHSIISEQDREVLPLAPTQPVTVLPNGVDLGFFQPQPNVPTDHDIVFVGNLGYFPNLQASRSLIKDILPQMAGRPRLLLAGAAPPPELQQLVRQAPQVTLTGWLDDIRAGYARGKVFAAPLFTGSGQQNKILEAMAMGLPCVVTPLVHRGIGGTPGRDLLVADSPAAFAAAIAELLRQPAQREAMGQAARRFVEQTYGWSAMKSPLLRWLDTVD